MAESSILQFSPLPRHRPLLVQAEGVRSRCNNYRGVSILRSTPAPFPLSQNYSVFRRQQLLSLQLIRSEEFLPRASAAGAGAEEGGGSSSSSSLRSVIKTLLGILGFLVRIPALFGYLQKEKKFIENAEEQIEEVAELMEGLTEAVENVAEAVAKVAEDIAGDAREARDLIEKVEETTKEVTTDIGETIDDLEQAVKAGKPSAGTKVIKRASKAANRAAEKAETVKDAAIQAADKAQKVKEAASELEKTAEAEAEVEEKLEEVKSKSKAATEEGQKTKSVNKYQVVSPNKIKFSKLLMTALWLGVAGVTLTQIIAAGGLIKYLSLHSFLRAGFANA